RNDCESVAKDPVESRLDQSVQGLAEPAIGINELAAVIREPQVGSRTCPGVLEKSKPGGLVQFAQPSPRMSIRHAHAPRSTPQRSQPVDCFEQVSLALAEQRTWANREPDLRLDTETARTRGMTSHGRCAASFISLPPEMADIIGSRSSAPPKPTKPPTKPTM